MSSIRSSLALVLLAACSVACAPTPTAGSAGKTPTKTEEKPASKPADKLEIPVQILPTLPGGLEKAAQSKYTVQANLTETLLASAIRDTVGPFLVGAAAISVWSKLAADAYAKGELVVDKPLTVRAPLPLTFLLTHPDDGYVLAFYEAAAVIADQQTAAIKFNSKTKGEAVYRARQPDGLGLRRAMALRFDLDAGTAVGDNLEDRRGALLPGGIKRIHGEFTKQADGSPSAFKLRMGGYFDKVAFVDDGVWVLSANFLTNGQAAAIIGKRPAKDAASLGDNVLFVPNVASGGADVGHDFYLNPLGLAIGHASADAGLKAVLPPDSDIARPFPANPASGDPFADATFAFPK